MTEAWDLVVPMFRKRATHKQWNFCVLKNVDPWGMWDGPFPHYICQKFFIVQALCTKKYVPSQSARTLCSPFTNYLKSPQSHCPQTLIYTCM